MLANRCDALSPMHDEAGRGWGSELPMDVGSRPVRPDAAAMHALQMAPGTRGGEVVGLVAAACRTELKVMGCHVPAAAHRARAAVSIADVDSSVVDARVQQVLPGLPQR
jgi:hypothetical protein